MKGVGSSSINTHFPRNSSNRKRYPKQTFELKIKKVVFVLTFQVKNPVSTSYTAKSKIFDQPRLHHVHRPVFRAENDKNIVWSSWMEFGSRIATFQFWPKILMYPLKTWKSHFWGVVKIGFCRVAWLEILHIGFRAKIRGSDFFSCDTLF